MTSETIQLIIGIGQILAVAVIPIIIWFCGIKYQNRKARRNAQLQLFFALMANRQANPIMRALNPIDVMFQEKHKVRHA